MLKLYGTSKSRSARSLWAVEELGLKYEHIPTAISHAKSSDHLRVNPNGHIPAIDDDGSIIWKSMANLYLAEKYGKGTLWPASVEDHGHAYKWSFFGMTEMESHLLTLLNQRVLLPAEKRDEKVAQRVIDALRAPLAVLDGALQGKHYLLGNSFTIADLNVASVLSWAIPAKLTCRRRPQPRRGCRSVCHAMPTKKLAACPNETLQQIH